jgi:peptidoglycan/LPS O-acetylase OafA/YrhL
LGVIAFHTRAVFTNTWEMPGGLFQFVSQGRLGVTLFFVLSGFLITGILLDSRESPGYFRRFYFRRALRIFPLYFAYLLLIFVVVRAVWVFATGDDPWKSVNSWWYLTYLQNLPAAHASGNLFLNQLWSLAVEEHFYLVWPAVVLLTPRKSLAWLCLALVALALALRCALPWDGEAIYRFSPCRVDGLALGAFIAIGWREFREPLERWTPRILAVSGMALCLIVAFSPSPTWDGAIRTYGESVAVVAAACVVFLARAGHGKFLSSNFLRQCGKYSYAMYVLHVAPQVLIEPRLRTLAGPLPLVLTLKYLFFPVLAVVTYGLARISWHFLEAPFLRLKDAAGVAAPLACQVKTFFLPAEGPVPPTSP